MKVFLLYPDKDFVLDQRLPSNEADLTQDLELNTLFDAMGQGDKYLSNVAKRVVLSSLDRPEVIRYRQEILRDCVAHPDVVRQIYQIPITAMEKKRGKWMGIFTSYPSGILNSALKMLEMFVEQLKVLRQLVDAHAAEFKSPGFQRFFSMIRQELDDDYFGVVETHLRKLRFRGGVLLSAQLGRGNEGTNYVLRESDYDDQNWFERVFSSQSPAYSYTLHPRDDAGARALANLEYQGVNLVANAAAQSADHIDSFFNMLRLELAFYIGCVNLAEKLALQGELISLPQVTPNSERRHSFTGLYDVALALTMKQKVVGNEVNADGKDLVIITGANQGGKSTFLRSIGLAQLMMQCGMFVPAESFSANLCRGLFTHYRREEDASMESGKFDEELGRMSAIVDTISPNALLLFNESFAATNEREGSEIAGQIVSALLERRVKVFFVTHMYEFAQDCFGKSMENAIFLRAERQPDGQRTFKLTEGKPLQTSFGEDLYHRIFGTDSRTHARNHDS